MKHYSDSILEEAAVREARRLIAGVLLDEVKRHGEKWDYTSLNAICDLANDREDYKTRISRRINPKDATPFLEELLGRGLAERATIHSATKDPPQQSYKAHLGHLGELKLVARKGTFLHIVPLKRSVLREAGYKGAQQRGKVIWSDAEKEYALTLSCQPEYKSPLSGKRHGQINNITLARELNNTFHENKPVRTPEAVCAYLSKIRTALKSPPKEGKRKLWSPEEKERAYTLSRLPEYQWHAKDGLKVHNAAIARELNREFHLGREIRDRLAIGRLLNRYDRSEER